MSRELFGKLARLRREVRAEVASPAPVSEALPDWFRRRGVADGAVADATAAPLPGCTFGPPAELVEHRNERGSFAARERVFARAHRHGSFELCAAERAEPAELAWLTREPALAALDPRTAVYLDIETTGLAGGSGTIPFLVALGRFEHGEFRLWQAFLRHPGEEAAALHEVAARVRAASGLVSFFGKSFDRHRLEDKMRLHRIAPPFAELPHLDLYHPLRRFHGAGLADTRLATMERALAGVERADDLPGSLAPAAWFDFLAERPHRLEGVFQHNELDVLSLVVLCAHLGATRAERGCQSGASERTLARALAELYAERREFAAALAELERALAQPGGDDGELCFRRAECLRRLGRAAEALALHLELARSRRDALAARSWLAAAKLARRAGSAKELAEALGAGPRAAEFAPTVRQRATWLAEFERLARRAAAETAARE